MLEFIFASENFPFTIALTAMLIIAVLEGIGAMIGTGLSGFIDQLIPGSEIAHGPDPDTPTKRLFSWLRVRDVPVLIQLVLFLLIFGTSGLLVQDLALSYFGALLSAMRAAILTLVVSLLVTRVLAAGLAKIIPKDETSAVSIDSLVGSTAQITLGIARKGYPTRGKTRDRFGKMHYFMLEPERQEDTFEEGEVVLLVRHDRSRFYAERLRSVE